MKGVFNMPTKKNIGRWPVVLADYADAVNSRIDPVHKELLMDYSNKDMMFYDAVNGAYVSFIDLVRSGMVNIWKEPCINYETMLATYPEPDLMTIVPVIDSGIIYMYVGNGKWLPISANGIPLANEETNGLMSSKNYKNLQDLLQSCRIRRYNINEQVPIPKDRQKNVLYSICTDVVPDPADIRWVQVNTEEKEYDDGYMRLLMINPETGELDYQMQDPVFEYVRSQSQIKPVEITSPYATALLYMIKTDTTIFELDKIENNLIDPKPDWKYNRYIYVDDADGQMYDIVDPAFVNLRKNPLGSITDDNFSDIFYVKETSDVARFTFQRLLGNIIPDKPDYEYERTLFEDSDGKLYEVVDPAFANTEEYPVGSVVLDDRFSDAYYQTTTNKEGGSTE